MIDDIAAVGPPSSNYTKTKDPNLVMGKYGAPITYGEFINANKNGYAWKNFHAYADYVGGWAKPIPKETIAAPYYRTPGGAPNIPTYDIEVLKNRYNDQPQVLQALNRNIAKPGEVPQLGPDDADLIRALIAKEKYTSGTYTTMPDVANLKKN